MTQTLVISIDFINDIVHPEGKIARSSAYVQKYGTVEKANRLLHYARQNHHLIAHVRLGFSRGYLECPSHSPVFGEAKKNGALQLGTWGTEFHSELDVQAEDIQIIKHRVSALYGTDLSTYLSANRIQTLILCGVSTHMAIEALTRELHDRDYSVIVASDACACMTEEMQTASLTLLRRLAQVKTVDEILGTSILSQ